VSSAILYLAIIAIWACVLVPRLIRKPHRALPAQDDLISSPYPAHAGRSAVGLIPDPVGNPVANLRNEAEDAWDERAAARTQLPRTAQLPPAGEQGIAWHRVTQRRSVHTEHAEHQAHPLPGRSGILQARRRLLTMLVTLMITALACTGAKLAPSWILVAPIGMLGMYLLVLREAAVADAEQEHSRAAERAAQADAARAAQADAARAAQADAARERARRAWEASQPQPESEPTAQIIDISARVTDQLYDQYADAALRAVGD
jgi:hypothetical protein